MTEIVDKHLGPSTDYGDWFRWLAGRTPAQRILTREECHILAREFDRLRVIDDAQFIVGARADFAPHAPHCPNVVIANPHLDEMIEDAAWRRERGYRMGGPKEGGVIHPAKEG